VAAPLPPPPAPTTPASTSSAARTMPIVLVFRVATDVR
jgi:hypothetical protein